MIDPAPTPCLFLGRPVAGPERERLGLPHARDWRACEHPERPLGPIVCPCNGCGPSCPSFDPEPDLESL